MSYFGNRLAQKLAQILQSAFAFIQILSASDLKIKLPYDRYDCTPANENP